MRVTSDLRDATRRRLLDKAAGLFASHGWDQTTTRDIAAAAGLANGTLFNYFRTKEAIAATLVAEALAAAAVEFDARTAPSSLEEDLFSYVWLGFRHLRPHRSYLKPVVESVLGPLASAQTSTEGDDIRREHLDRVRVIAGQSLGLAPSPLTLQVYWSLYVGLLSYWIADASPKQEDSLALLHHTIHLFVASLRSTAVGGQDVHQPR